VVVPRRSRISLSIQEELLREFDAVAKGLGHDNRSKAVGEAMRGYISGSKWDQSARGEVSGAVLVTYDHHSRGVNKALTELQHDHTDLVTATMHIHLSKDKCLEIIAFKGPSEKVRSMAKTIQSQNGVLELKVVTAHV
jgi:CopG family nickel-responsive transcriptional regulator